MPIHLTPLQRRTFLQTTLGAGASLLTFHTILADESDTEIEHVALLADTHIDADPTKIVRGAVMASNLLRVVADILSQPQKPVMALIDGDCAFNKGLPPDYQTLSSLIAPILAANIPLNMTMGNHDDRSAFLAQFTSFEGTTKAVAGKHVTLVQTKFVNWFLIDTLQHVNQVTGEVGAEQRHWLQTALEANSDKPAIVVGHHNPQFEVPASGRVTGIQDSAPLFTVLDSLPHVQAYVFGHTHNWNITQRESGVSLINLPPVGYVFEKTKPLGWVDAQVHASGIDLVLHTLNATDSAHPTTHKIAWRSSSS